MNEIGSIASGAVPGFWLMMLKSIGMLCVVIAFLVGVLYVIKKFSETRSGRMNKSLIKMLGSFHIGPKERLMLIDVMEKKILIGVTQHSINCLAIIDGTGGMKAPSGETESSFEGLMQKFSKSPLPDAEEGVSDERK